MDTKGDIPEADEIKPDATDFDTGKAKVELVDEIVSAGGTAHVYCRSINRAPEDDVDAEDVHVYEYNSHRFPEMGLIYVMVGDDELWIAGSDIGAIERHYE